MGLPETHTILKTNMQAMLPLGSGQSSISFKASAFAQHYSGVPTKNLPRKKVRHACCAVGCNALQCSGLGNGASGMCKSTSRIYAACACREALAHALVIIGPSTVAGRAEAAWGQM